jgi:N,N'-diacetylchitobiose transport system substrate-binding protein
VQQKLATNDPSLKAFVDTLKAGTKFVPATPAWSKIDSQNVLPTAVQQIATGGKDPSAALTEAAAAMDKAFG